MRSWSCQILTHLTCILSVCGVLPAQLAAQEPSNRWHVTLINHERFVADSLKLDERDATVSFLGKERKIPFAKLARVERDQPFSLLYAHGLNASKKYPGIQVKSEVGLSFEALRPIPASQVDLEVNVSVRAGKPYLPDITLTPIGFKNSWVMQLSISPTGAWSVNSLIGGSPASKAEQWFQMSRLAKPGKHAFSIRHDANHMTVALGGQPLAMIVLPEREPTVVGWSITTASATEELSNVIAQVRWFETGSKPVYLDAPGMHQIVLDQSTLVGKMQVAGQKIELLINDQKMVVPMGLVRGIQFPGTQKPAEANSAKPDAQQSKVTITRIGEITQWNDSAEKIAMLTSKDQELRFALSQEKPVRGKHPLLGELEFSERPRAVDHVRFRMRAECPPIHVGSGWNADCFPPHPLGDDVELPIVVPAKVHERKSEQAADRALAFSIRWRERYPERRLPIRSWSQADLPFELSIDEKPVDLIVVEKLAGDALITRFELGETLRVRIGLDPKITSKKFSLRIKLKPESSGNLEVNDLELVD